MLWLDSTLLNSVSVAYICIFNSSEWWLIMLSGADQCWQNTGWTTNDGWMDACMDKWMNGWINGWMERMVSRLLVDRWMDSWIINSTCTLRDEYIQNLH